MQKGSTPRFLKHGIGYISMVGSYRSRTKNSLRHFAHPFLPKIYRGEKVSNLASVFDLASSPNLVTKFGEDARIENWVHSTVVIS